MKKFIPMAIKHKISGVKNEIYSKKIYLKRKITRKFGHSLTREMSDYLREIDEKGFVTIKRPEFIRIANILNPPPLENENKSEINFDELQGVLVPGISNSAGISNYWCSFKIK
jgi:hypothetical protein